MSKTKDRITQVKLSRYAAGNIAFDVVWIDSAFAKVGKRVRIDGSNVIWTVEEVYGSKDVDDLEMQFKVWREFQDKLGY